MIFDLFFACPLLSVLFCPHLLSFVPASPSLVRMMVSFSSPTAPLFLPLLPTTLSFPQPLLIPGTLVGRDLSSILPFSTSRHSNRERPEKLEHANELHSLEPSRLDKLSANVIPSNTVIKKQPEAFTFLETHPNALNEPESLGYFNTLSSNNSPSSLTYLQPCEKYSHIGHQSLQTPLHNLPQNISSCVKHSMASDHSCSERQVQPLEKNSSRSNSSSDDLFGDFTPFTSDFTPIDSCQFKMEEENIDRFSPAFSFTQTMDRDSQSKSIDPHLSTSLSPSSPFDSSRASSPSHPSLPLFLGPNTQRFTISTAKSKDVPMTQSFLNHVLPPSNHFDSSFLLQYVYKSGHFLLIMTNDSLDQSAEGFVIEKRPAAADPLQPYEPVSRSTSLSCRGPKVSINGPGSSAHCFDNGALEASLSLHQAIDQSRSYDTTSVSLESHRLCEICKTRGNYLENYYSVSDNASHHTTCSSSVFKRLKLSPQQTAISSLPKSSRNQREIIGVIAGHILPSTRHRSSDWHCTVSAYVSILAVDPEYRRSGVAAALLGKLERELAREALVGEQYWATNLVPRSHSNSFSGEEAKSKRVPMGWSFDFSASSDSLSSSPSSISSASSFSSLPSSPASSISSISSSACGGSLLESIVLDVETTNLVAQNFYKKQGFYVSSPVKKGYYKSSGKSSVEMRKVLIG